MKRLLWIAGPILLLAALVLSLPYIVSADRFRPLLQSRLQSAIGRPVEFADLELRLFPISLRAYGLKVPGLLTAELVSVRVRALPLLSGNVEVESVTLNQPIVQYTAKPSAGPAPAFPDLAAFNIVDGRLLYTGEKGETSEYTDIDASIRTEASQSFGEISWKNTTLPVTLHFRAARANGLWDFSQLDIRAGAVTAAFTGKIDTAKSTVNGALKISPTSLAGLPINSPYKPKGEITADVKLAGPWKQPALTGAVQINNLEISGGKLTQPLRASALGLALTPNKIFAAPFSLQSGPTQVQATFQLMNYKTIDATISTANANLQDLLVIAQAGDVTATGSATLQLRATGPVDNPQLSGSGSLANADFHLPALNPHLKIDSAAIKFEAASAAIDNAVFHIGNTNGRGSITIRDFARPRIALSLQLDQLSNTEAQSWFPPAKPGAKSTPVSLTGDLAATRLQVNNLTLENFKSNLDLHDQLLTLSPLSANLYGGRVTGSASVNLKKEPAEIALKTHLEKIESEQLLAAATPLRKVVSGPLTADADLHFAPKPGEDFARTLSGTLNLQLAQGKLLPLNLLGEINNFARFLKPLQAAPANTPFLGMKGSFQIANGALQTDDLRLELDRAAALITGTANLTDQSLNLRMLTTLNKQFSDEVGGTRIGGFLSAALASPKGELLIPSLVKGSFSKPVISPDAATVGKMKLSQPQSLQEGVKGIMDLFKSRKKED